jgi:hypothetical protein
MSGDEPSKRAHATLPLAVLSAHYFTVAEQDISASSPYPSHRGRWD